MKKVDVLLGCEIKGRELESLCLLKHELEKRGYSVEIASFMELRGAKKAIYDAEIFASGGMRFWANIPYQIGRGVKFRKHIEMPWEQVYQNCVYRFDVKRDQIGFETVATVWGENHKKYLIDHEKLRSDKIFVSGHPVMDFCKPRFDRYYLDRETIALKYKLDISKKWNLFTSSFVMTSSGEQYWIDYDSNNKVNMHQRQYHLEIQSQKKILEWFEMALDANSDQIIIYRPHPDEVIIPEVFELDRKYKYFRIIRDKGVIQWLRVCDCAYTWISTSTAEAYFSGKPSYVVRPVKVPEDLEIITFKHSEKFICDYETFNRTLGKKANEFSISGDTLNDFYYYDPVKYTYSILGDLFELVMDSDKYLITSETQEKITRYMDDYDKKLSMYRKAVRSFKASNYYNIYHRIFMKNQANNHVSKSEIHRIENNIKRCIG